MALDNRLVRAFGIGTAGGLTVGLCIGLGLWLASRPAGSRPIPPPSKTGEFVLVIVDDDRPTVKEGALLDGPRARSLKNAKRMTVRTDTWRHLKERGYDKLVTQAGGAPMIAVLNKDGGVAHVQKIDGMDETQLEQLCQKYVTGLPPPVSGVMSDIRPLNAGAPNLVAGGAVVVNGQRMMLSSRPGEIRALAKYGDSNPIFAESEWREIDCRAVFGSQDWIFNQGQHGSCVGQAGVGALMRARWTLGMGFLKLSPTCLYGQINGGQDHGAVISDIIQALQNTGTCKFETVGQNLIYPRQFPRDWKKEASRFKLGEAYQCDTFEELMSAVQTGRYYPVFGVQVGGNWTHFDRFGVAGHDRGPGNHALHADGVRRTGDRRWVFDTVNSWGYEWGPFNNGRVFLDKAHLFANGVMPNIVVVRMVTDDPADDSFPIYKGV